jgi:subtilisin family serine protease
MSTKTINFPRILWHGLNLVVIAAMLLGVWVGVVQASQTKVPVENEKIDPNIYVALEQRGNARVLVILKEQADLRAASNLETKVDKGTFVYQRLTEIASRTQAPLRDFLEAKAATYRAYWIQNMFMVNVDSQLLQELIGQPGIARIDLYHPPYPDVVGNDLGSDFGPEFGPLPPISESQSLGSNLGAFGQEFGPQPTGSIDTIEWNILRVNADDAWAIGVDGTGAVIGDLDTGVQWDHPALINRYRGWNGSEADHNYNWWDGLIGSPVPTDYDGHGTHTMGTIVGDDGAGNQIGMAPGAKWMACPGIGSPYVEPFECFQFFLAPTDLNGENPRPDLAPHVISNSWSSAGTDFHAAIQALYAAGIFFSKSAGNTGSGCSSITNPGQWSEVTAAAAFAQGDTIASFSSRGPVLFGHDYAVKPDIAAPGVNVRSSYPGDGYTTMQGTSMACPHITGAVALLISANPELAGRIDILQMLLKQYAEPKVSAQCTPFVDHPNDVWGWGILNAYDAVVAAQTLTIGNLQGTVTDASTGDPISDTLVIFSDVVNQWNFSATSGGEGYYLQDLPAAKYDVTASHYGYDDTTIPDVDVVEGISVTQDISLTPASVWVVSGVVTDSVSQAPLAASISFEKTPVMVQTNPDTGLYIADVAQGTWWMNVSSPGHSGQSLQLVVDQDQIADFSLDPIYNYYMHRSVDGVCGPAFNWMDAVSGGIPRPMGDDAYTLVTLPTTFSFYGNIYTNIYIGSNGIADFTLDSGTSKWSGPIPDPAEPNNGIYAFSQDLNPANGIQGNIYTKYIDNRYFVIEWYQVQHYPSGNPETFEIVLDMDTKYITIQYLTVSDPTTAVSGVENSTGTEATQYAYDDPVLIADNRAVTFYPQFGTPPPTGGLGEMTGEVSDAISGTPIQAATVIAEAYSSGTVYTFTTDANGIYSAPLCSDWYTTSADAAGYYPILDINVTILEGAQSTQDYALTPICDACMNVDFSWLPLSPIEGESVVFTGITSGTLPITYTWDFGDGEVASGQQVAHVFSDAGTFTVTLTVDNCAGIPVTQEYVVNILPLFRNIFLPLAVR